LSVKLVEAGIAGLVPAEPLTVSLTEVVGSVPGVPLTVSVNVNVLDKLSISLGCNDKM